MLRFELSEVGQVPLPPLDLDGETFVIGSAGHARLRLPAIAARDEHVQITRDGSTWRWLALADATIDDAPISAGATGTIGDGIVVGIGAYRVAIRLPTPGAIAASPQRTESLARELLRTLLGEGGLPALEIERGPTRGARRALPAPEAMLVIGRGDEAGWVILDEDLSRTHAELRRGWDGTRIVDLGSKNGTRVDGVEVDERDGLPLHDGAQIDLGKVRLRFLDPAERHLRGTSVTPAASVAITPVAVRIEALPPIARGPRVPMLVALVIATLAITALIALFS